MKRIRLSVEQIAAALRQHAAGLSVAELARKLAARLQDCPDVVLIDIGASRLNDHSVEGLVLRVHLRRGAEAVGAAPRITTSAAIDEIPIVVFGADYRLE